MSAAPSQHSSSPLSSHRFLTAPNVFTLLRLCCIPLFLYLLFGKDNRAAAAWLLGGLGATDWVDGWLARRFNQVGKASFVVAIERDKIEGTGDAICHTLAAVTAM